MTIPEESLSQAAERIRAMRPIVGDRATNEDCTVRRELIELTLARRGVEAGERCWFTAQLVDGHIAGCWAQSVEEAELEISVWHGAACHWVIADPDTRVRAEYVPARNSIRLSTLAFPLAPPRTPRDRFGPTTSLLDTLEPASTPGVGR